MTMQLNPSRRWHRFRVIIPAYPAYNIYSGIAGQTTALGPIYIATVASKLHGWSVEVIDENNFHRLGPRDQHGRPDHAMLQNIRAVDVAGFYGGLTSTVPRLYELAAFYRSQGVITIGGGQHFVPENLQEGLNSGLDYIVTGEGEQTLVELLDALKDSRSPTGIQGLAYMEDDRLISTPDRPPLTDFETLPMPDFSLMKYARMKLFPVGWVRGCGMDCEFCTVKGKARCPAPEYVLEQMAAAVERWHARQFFLVDDLFGQNRQATLDLCRMLENYQTAVKRRLRITVQIRLDKGRDQELLHAMKKAGITIAAIGFESPIPEELEAMKKRVKPEEMLALTRLYHTAGLLVHGMFIFGYPIIGNSTYSMGVDERIRHFRNFIRKARIDTVQILLPVPLPGTEMTRRLTEAGRVFPRELVGWEYYDGNFPLFQPDPPLTPEDMQFAMRKITGRFYRFRHIFMIAVNILIFPAIILARFNIRFGWRTWYRLWRNELLRFGGWIVFRRWTAQLRQGDFAEKLTQVSRRSRDTDRPTTTG